MGAAEAGHASHDVEGLSPPATIGRVRLIAVEPFALRAYWDLAEDTPVSTALGVLPAAQLQFVLRVRDAARAAFRYADLPRVAQDARAHGLEEVVIWGWSEFFKIPARLREELGTREEFLAGIEKSRALGVNMAPFFSIQIILDSEVERLYLEWGLKEVHGLVIDGRDATCQTLVSDGPEELCREIVTAIRAECGLNPDERKN